MRAYVLCGGLGTRLRSITGETQKALVPVHGQPFLSTVLQQLAQAGVVEVVLCAHYRADQVAAQLDGLAQTSGLRLHLVVEPALLGTGGALLNALQQLPAQGRYLVLNADTYLQAEAYRLVSLAPGNAVLAVMVGDRSRYGSLSVDATGGLSSIAEKGQQGPGLVNGGVYAFCPEALEGSAVSVCSLERDLLPGLVQHQRIDVLEYAGHFIDIGTPESFARYSAEFETDLSQ